MRFPTRHAGFARTRTRTRIRHWRCALVVSLGMLASAAHALNPGFVNATAAGAVDSSSTEASASASNAGFTAAATRQTTHAEGAISNGFTAGRTVAEGSTRSNFSIVGLNGMVPLTFHWEFSGSVGWNIDNASFGREVTAQLAGPGFLTFIGWGTSFVQAGNSAGSYTGGIGAQSAGVEDAFRNDLPTGLWDGRGTRLASTTMQWATDGAEGSFYLASNVGLSGSVVASMNARLLSVTAADASLLQPEAYLLLDNGSRIAITSAVPEPETWAMLVAGLLTLGAAAHGRRR